MGELIGDRARLGPQPVTVRSADGVVHLGEDEPQLLVAIEAVAGSQGDVIPVIRRRPPATAADAGPPATAVLVLGFNFLGDGLRDLTDPKSR